MRQLSPWDYSETEELFINGRPNNIFDIAGITTLDFMELPVKFTYVNRESYRLDFVNQRLNSDRRS